MRSFTSNNPKAVCRHILGALMAVVLATPGYAGDEQAVVLKPYAGLERVLSGVAERLELADTLRVLSHEIPAAACHLANGVAPDSSRYRLKMAKKRFPRYLNALEFGDADFGINAPKTRHATLQKKMAKIGALWVKVDEAIYRLTYLPQDGEAHSLLKAETEELFEQSSLLMTELEAKYHNPFEMTSRDAMLLDIAGRQTALTQLISKISCEIWAGDRTQDRRTELSQTIALFERGIRALLDGLPELGVIAAPTPEIETALAVLVSDWAGVREMLTDVMAGDANKSQMTTLYGRLDEKRSEMARIVGLYADYSKRIY